MIINIFAVVVFALIGIGTWIQIPKEDPEIVQARKEYGKC
jgi:hypothetical protein